MILAQLGTPGRPRKPYAGRIYPLEQRLIFLCRREGVGPSRLGLDAGLSDDAIPGIIEENRKGRAHPGAAETYWAIAERYGVSLDWLFGQSELPEYTGKR